VLRNYTSVQQPPSDAIIWRYFNKENFLRLFEKEALHFAKASSLRDPFEGRFPLKFKGITIDDEILFPLDMNDQVYICCFTLNNPESAILWNFYLKNDLKEGGAICFTISDLKSCLNECEEEITLSSIEYSDYRTLNPQDDFYPFFNKRVEYSIENEFRALIYLSLANREKTEKGFYLPIPLKKIIRKIVLAPHTPDDFANKVFSLCKEKNLENVIFRSSLEDKPNW